VWSPDGRRIAFEGENGLYQVASNGAAPSELLLKPPGRVSIDSWSSDGKFLFYTEAGPKTSSLRALPLSDERKPTPVVESAFNVRRGRISPDGRWIAYVSDETGRDEIYVQTFPAGGGKWVVSGNGGTHPEWRGDGRELFFASPERMIMSVMMAGGANAMEAGIAHPLFRIPGPATFAVTRDGLRFLVKMPATDPESEAIHVVLNWTAELQRR
jgi:Tol biopolymer transport system component